MKEHYFGLDVGGLTGTILTLLTVEDGKVRLRSRTPIRSIDHLSEELRRWMNEEGPRFFCVDAPLTYDSASQSGDRAVDRQYRNEIPKRFGKRKWVLSPHGLMAVPIKGWLAARVAEDVLGATVLETHPRIFLARTFESDESLGERILTYKSNAYAAKKHQGANARSVAAEATHALWRALVYRFAILDDGGQPVAPHPDLSDNCVDSLACAISAMLAEDPRSGRGDRAVYKRRWEPQENVMGLKEGFYLHFLPWMEVST